MLAPAHEDVDELADFEIASDHGIDVAVARALREVGRELVQRGRFRRLLALQLAQRVGAPVLPVHRHRRHGGVFVGTGRDVVEVVLDAVQVEFREQRRHTVRKLRQLGRIQQRLQQVAAADAGLASRAQVEGRDQPRVLEQLRQALGKHRRARVAALEAGHFRLQVGLEPFDRDA
jgi:hypothetical protein